MTKKDIKVNTPLGIHVRIACEIIEIAKSHNGKITMKKADTNEIVCTMPLLMLALNVKCGDIVTVQVECQTQSDEQLLLNKIAQILDV